MQGVVAGGDSALVRAAYGYLGAVGERQRLVGPAYGTTAPGLAHSTTLSAEGYTDARQLCA